MESGNSPGFDIGPDIDRRGLPIRSSAGSVQRAVNGHGGMNGYNSNSSASDLQGMDDLEEDTPTQQRYIRERFPQGNVLGLPGAFAYPAYEPLDESTDPPLHRSTSQTEFYQNGHQASDSSLDEMARGTSPWVMEATRLKSFRNWPYGSVPRSIKPEDLAKDGFRYVGPSDTVQCVFCRQRLKHWEEGDSVRGEHQRYKPQCPFITGQTRQNIPLTEEERSDIVLTYLTREAIPRPVRASEIETSPSDSLEGPRAKYPDLSVEATRLASFVNWPSQMHQKPEDLSKAGFVYLNSGDMVYCFFCGEMVHEWERDDDPWVEHAIINPNCYFVKMVKGEDFIQMARKGVAVASSGESDSVETLLEKPACLALLHDGYSKEQLSVALARMIHREAGPDVYRADAIREELDNLDREKAVALSKNTAVQGAAANPVESSDNRDKGVKDLEEENKHLKEQRVCKVCLDNEINVIFLPCAHLVCCASCGLALKECPVCRQAISKTTKAYWA